MGNRELLLLLSLGRASEEGLPAELPELAVVGAGPVPHLVGGQVLHAAGAVLAARHRGQASHRGHLQQQRLVEGSSSLGNDNKYVYYQRKYLIC